MTDTTQLNLVMTLTSLRDNLKTIIVSNEPEAQKLLNKSAPFLASVSSAIKRLEKVSATGGKK